MEWRGVPRRLLRLLGQAELAVALVAFCGVIGLVSAQVLLRFAFDYGVVWIQEVAQLAILVAYFFGTSYVFKTRQYLVITLVFDRLAAPARIPLYVAAQVLTAAFCLLLVVQLLGLAPGQLRMRTFVLHIPRFYASVPLLIASASMAVTAIYFGLAVGLRARWGDGRPEEVEAAVSLFPRSTGGSAA